MTPIGMRKRGELAEELVTAFLIQSGTQILARNLRLGHLEIDILAREGPVLVVVEVRCRSSSARTSGFSSIGTQKILRLRRAAERIWRRRYRNDPSIERVRFDVASVTENTTGTTIEYTRAAF